MMEPIDAVIGAWGMARFSGRAEAGRRLGAELARFRDEAVVVLGLPRGGVPVAAEVAASLGAPIDVIVVRKVGVPVHSELAMGAIGEGGVVVRNDDVLRTGAVTDAVFEREEASERRELEARVERFRRGRERVDLRGRTALIVDDGLATGATARAACLVARELGATRVVVASPVGPPELAADDLGADELVLLERPRSFRAVGAHYVDFRPTSDDEVARLLGV